MKLYKLPCVSSELQIRILTKSERPWGLLLLWIKVDPWLVRDITRVSRNRALPGIFYIRMLVTFKSMLEIMERGSLCSAGSTVDLSLEWKSLISKVIDHGIYPLLAMVYRIYARFTEEWSVSSQEEAVEEMKDYRSITQHWYIHMSTRNNKGIGFLLVEPLDLERVIHKSKRAVDTLQAAIGSIEIQTSIDTFHLTSIDTVHLTSIDTAHQPSIDTVHPPSTDTV
ncbi:hypothetical protein DY000_02007996 [Brassica cretica]|uniref:Uncharacterized protein n=1 Tax=Brassica cretica TaxID=69181 RepID=A0ABQ7C5C8_BRACR|nr:hypothetical protein DY000_02007996 [Brassica cretica]